MDLSNHSPNPDIFNQLDNSSPSSIHIIDSSGTDTNLQDPNWASLVSETPCSDVNSVQGDLLSLPVPKGKRRGRPRYAAWSLNNGSRNAGASVIKTQMQNTSNSIKEKQGSSSNSSTPAKKTIDGMSDEIIVINKDATAEALIALTAGFPADSLTEEEVDYGVVSEVGGIEQVNYILIRNHIITKWRENVSTWITKEMFVGVVPEHCRPLLDTTYDYLVSHGYINFGVAPAIKEKILVEPKKPNVIVVGAGLSGLAAARQLMAFGFKVTVLEGRRRPGGRVYTKKLGNGNTVAAVDLGGSVLTGTLGNPLGILARQLNFVLHKVRDKCPLYRVDGMPVDPDLDRKVETSFNQLLDKLSKVRQSMGEVSRDVSLGAALMTFREAFTEEENSLFNWHLANLEYANASLVSMLSLAFWDQDDPYDMGGDHCFLPGGNGKLVEALVENVPVQYGKTVESIHYGGDGVQVAVGGGQVYKGDMVLCTVPLGVLKSRSIRFVPELPQRKLDAIKRLGFGVLNKVGLLFPHVFWGTDLDTFGHLSHHSGSRGEYFLFYSYATVAGGPLLIALVAGEAAYKFENEDPTVSVRKVLGILKGIYEPKGIEVPNPLQTCCTRWGSDPLSRGSYSSVAVGASGDDYDILAESVGDGRLFFAGEATNRRYPATMHGALLSGFREAANMAHYARIRSSGLTVEKNPSQNAHTCALILADLFRQPDFEFGSFAVLNGRKNANSMAILKVTFGGNRKKPDQQYSNKLLFEQLQSHFNQQQEFHIYTLISRKQAHELREVRGGDEARFNYLCETLGVKLLGRKGLGPSADSVIASIKAERSKRSQSQKSSSSGISMSKAALTKRKLIRKAKIVRSSNKLSIPSKNIECKARGNGNNIEHMAHNGNEEPSSTNLHNGVETMDDMRCFYPQNLGHNSNTLTTSMGPNLSLTHTDVDMDLLGDTHSNNVSFCLPSSETEAKVVGCDSSLGASNIVDQSFDSQNYVGVTSDSISCISLQENIFEDIMNDLLPPSSANSGTWEFTEKLFLVFKVMEEYLFSFTYGVEGRIEFSLSDRSLSRLPLLLNFVDPTNKAKRSEVIEASFVGLARAFYS
ncbi:lysine-specific histone demethylase 1 homolog 3 [Striga asiatica]|uniref:Lysine-specific histone demethylase 1 homolog 3 n=1 Tax=Striga asiatica TaxID=4170 RepID=A0A5A7R0P4_STRAF|nr:lysine-specific histone demethylase 1 homolog 3 [Striga asiatica]